ncbi:Inner membrane protein YebE [Novipirellula artificiosorum]|uniref:Inner membrane protein YebE n=2 Tax=Novipirellula artificiosorum TaxID=2528016 RepID=A0A5C6DDQ6_9BACT|nr:Inner membrane protein YebE [Novipirellula artificiosorum]
MINAAKADGQLDQKEQGNILKHLSNPTPENLQFIREEFQRPLDARAFALSVPVGMEQQVYTISLIAIDLDTGQEAKYLMELAENLRLPAGVREQIHQRLGVPSIY